jgi:hypothetical protein
MLLLASAYWYFCTTLRPLPPHQGDGTFKDISFRFPYDEFGFPIRGYLTTFPEFDLGKGYEAEFRVADLPAIKEPVGVFLSVSDPDAKIRELPHKLVAIWEFEVLDSEGRIVSNVEKPLRDFVWSEPSLLGDAYGIYGPFFQARKGEWYTIRVRYRPDSQLRPFKGRVYLECGGSI